MQLLEAMSTDRETLVLCQVLASSLLLLRVTVLSLVGTVTRAWYVTTMRLGLRDRSREAYWRG